MQRSFVAKTTIHYVDYEFYVRPGDVLVHDTANQNRMTIYRNGEIAKVVKQEPIGVAAFLKNKFIEEIVEQTAQEAGFTPAVLVETIETISEPAPEPRRKRRNETKDEVLDTAEVAQ